MGCFHLPQICFLSPHIRFLFPIETLKFHIDCYLTFTHICFHLPQICFLSPHIRFPFPIETLKFYIVCYAEPILPTGREQAPNISVTLSRVGRHTVVHPTTWCYTLYTNA